MILILICKNYQFFFIFFSINWYLNDFKNDDLLHLLKSNPLIIHVIKSIDLYFFRNNQTYILHRHNIDKSYIDNHTSTITHRQSLIDWNDITRMPLQRHIQLIMLGQNISFQLFTPPNADNSGIKKHLETLFEQQVKLLRIFCAN
jgi:hypothetical protein